MLDLGFCGDYLACLVDFMLDDFCMLDMHARVFI